MTAILQMIYSKKIFIERKCFVIQMEICSLRFNLWYSSALSQVMSWRRTNSMQSLYEIHKAQYGHVICIDGRWKTSKKSINHCLCRNHFSEWTDHWSWRRVSWWRHQVETFSALLAICAVNSPITGEFPAQRPVTRNFDVFFDLSLNKRLRKNREAGDMRRHHVHYEYDVTVMITGMIRYISYFHTGSANSITS